MAGSSKKKPVVVVVVLALAGGAFYYYRGRPKPPAETVYYGNVDIRDVTLAFRVAGRVDRVLKHEGDPVAPGEVVATLDKTPYELALAQSRAAVEVANAQLKSVEAGARREDITQARAVLEERKAAAARAKDTFERVERLESTGAATKQGLIDARAATEQGQASVQAAQATLSKLLNGSRSEDIRVAQALARQAESAVALAELSLKDTELHAATAGVVVTRAVEPGAMVQVATPAFVVSFDDPVWVRAYAPEKDLAKLSPGTPVEVSTDARPDKPYAGQVGYVSPQAEFTPKNVETAELRSSLVYRFRVVITRHDGGLRQGMPVTVRMPKGAAPVLVQAP